MIIATAMVIPTIMITKNMSILMAMEATTTMTMMITMGTPTVTEVNKYIN